uniref:SEC14 domain and spectrin repeat-containing protein 1-like n=1 Tax=Saccoglossus kowalevskii TaxID=10224 RepID=A0ABM0MSN1_SACKO|nr:PREDICTED: SEC14 domain and spectrin repeat-containing protein 1-like [Saccoglossus kowalevskii]
MDAASIVEILRSQNAYLSGGKDHRGGPILSIPIVSDPSEFSPQDFATCIAYLAKIPSDEAKSHGFTILIDARGSTWNSVKPLLRILQQVLPEKIFLACIVKPEAFWEKQRAGQSLKKEKSQLDFEVLMFSSVAKLHKYCSADQLTPLFGGTLRYNHAEWIQNRLDYEKFVKDTISMLSRLDQAEMDIVNQLQDQEPIKPEELLWQHQRLKDKIVTQPNSLIISGQKLLQQLQLDEESGFTQGTELYQTEDHIIMTNHAKRLLDQLNAKQMKLEQYLDEQNRDLVQNVKLGDLQGGIKRVVDWIVGPGEKLLSSQHDIGSSYTEADKLRREHEKLELKCTDTYGMYAELRHVADTLIKENHPLSKDISAQRDYMDTVCRSFATRLERRRNLLITSVRFHRLVQDVLSHLEDFIDLLKSDILADDVESAEKSLRVLQQQWDMLSLLMEQAIREAHTLLDMMSETIKNAFGKDITPDYSPYKTHVQDILDDLQRRKIQCDELAEVRKLKLQQILQLRTCERDADQAIIWLMELCEVMVKSHTDVGQSASEAEHLKREHLKFESTAKGTYEYGKQLLQAALVLRRSLRFELSPNHERAQKLSRAWKQFSQGISERSSRLSVSYTFHRNSETIIDKLETFIHKIWSYIQGVDEKKREEILAQFKPERDQLMESYHDTVAMGNALLDRLMLPIVATERVQLPGSEPSEEYKNTTEIIYRLLDDLEWNKQMLDEVWNQGVEPRPPSRGRQGRRIREIEVKKEILEVRHTAKSDGEHPGEDGRAASPEKDAMNGMMEYGRDTPSTEGGTTSMERGVSDADADADAEFSSESEVFVRRETALEVESPVGRSAVFGQEYERDLERDWESMQRLEQSINEVGIKHVYKTVLINFECMLP